MLKTVQKQFWKKNKKLACTASSEVNTQPVSCNKQQTDAIAWRAALRRRVMYARVSNTLQDVAAGVAEKAAKQIEKPDA